MTVIVLYCFATLFYFVKVEPLTAIGAFLSVCYLPGLCIFSLSRKNKIVFEDLILAFPFSIGISGLLTAGMLFAGVHVKNVPLIIYAITGIIILFSIIPRIKKKACPGVFLNKQEVMYVVFAIFLLFILSIPYFTWLYRAAISPHAYHHSSFISQIINGIFPPENPGMGGTVIGYYWGFHALVAAIAVQTDFHHIQIIVTLNTISLFMLFCIVYSFARSYDLPERYRYIVPVAVIGLVRADIALYFIAKMVSGSLMPLDIVMSKKLLPMEIFRVWLKELSWLDTRLFVLSKFYNISAMPTAICLCLSYLLMIWSHVKKEALNKIFPIGLYIIVAASVLIYPPLAIITLLHAPVWSFYIFISNRGNYIEKVKEALTIILPYAIGVLTVLPYLLFIMAGRDVSSSGQGGVFSFSIYSQSVRNLFVYLIPSPLIVYGFWSAYKKLSYSREFFFLLIGTALCLGLSVFTKWPFDNSYKFNYILLIYFALFIAMALARLQSVLSNKLIARSIAAFTILLLLLSPIILEAAYILSYLSIDHNVALSERHYSYAQNKQKNEAYKWIRENTPPKALLMLSYIETSWPCCGLNHNYGPAAFAERTLYVTKDMDYTVSNPEYEKRVLFREKLFDNPEDQSVIDFFASLNRPVYLLIEDNLNESRFYVEDRFKSFSVDMGKEFVLVFQNEHQRVYHIRLNK